jgi:preprotein translocase subunit SecD
MTEINTEGGEVIQTDLPEEKVADLKQPEADPNPEPKAEEKQPESTEQPTKPEVKPEPIKERPKKAGPIADLLEKKHEAEERATKAEARLAEIEAQAQNISHQSPSQAADSIKALAEESGVDEKFISRIVTLAREGLGTPKEVEDLIQQQREAKIQEAETKAFNSRVDKLKGALKDDLLADPKVKDKLQELAYSTELAPDGEPYYQKELAEIYFAYVKPEYEPGKVSAEPSFGAKTGAEILDFEQIHNDDSKLEEFAGKSTHEQWQSYVKWRDGRASKPKIIRSKQV